jgi:hypothetical protein
MSFDLQSAKKYLRYDNGSFFWKERPGIRSRVRVGDRAGHLNKPSGYRIISLFGKKIPEHRLVWLFFGNTIEDGHVIDHINGIRDDNRYENLRHCTPHENMQNVEAVGAYWREHAKKFQAMIMVDGKSKSLGYYDTLEEARKEYLTAKKKYHTIYR